MTPDGLTESDPRLPSPAPHGLVSKLRRPVSPESGSTTIAPVSIVMRFSPTPVAAVLPSVSELPRPHGSDSRTPHVGLRDAHALES